MAKIVKKKAEPEPLLPSFNAPLIGLNAPQQLLLGAANEQRLHSAYLLAGRQGIGKSKLALQFAASLFAPLPAEIDMFGEVAQTQNFAIDWDSPAITQMQTHSNADFLYVRPAYNHEKKIFKDAIMIDEVRKIGRFTHLKSSNNWKIIVIDPAEAMNNQAMNALLKSLEEPPPQTVFLLISHNPSRLLPTIRSRCLAIHCPTPSLADFSTILQAQNCCENHDLLYHITGGSAGLALELQAVNFIQYWHKLLELLDLPSNQRLSNILSLAEKLTRDANFLLKHWQLLSEFIMFAAARFQAVGVPQNNAIPLAILQKLAPAKPQFAWLDAITANAELIDNAAILYLDKKHVIINSLNHF